jgi:predicted nucleotidyltransferase
MYGLSDYTLQTLNTIFKKYDGIQKVVLYGSRAKGNYKNGSDIDLTLFTNNTFTYADLLHISGEFYDSDMPYFVDVNIFDKLTNPDLKAHIERVGKTLYTKNNKENFAYHIIHSHNLPPVFENCSPRITYDAL